jgi:hypothetical protein
MSLYARTVAQLVREGRLDPSLPTLVVAGGSTDRQVLLDAGFTNITISNLDERMRGDEFAPCQWRFLDGENLQVEEGEYAQIIEHMGLHHCGSPHRGLLEMYRCAGRSVLVFENRDSASLRLAVRLGFVPEYEHEAVAGNGYVFGGWRNTGVPNAVYRWTEREVLKTLASYDPAHQISVSFYYGLRLPVQRIAMMRNPLLRLAFRLSLAPFRLLAALFPKQMNEFGFYIDKGARARQPWIDPETGALSRQFWAKGTWRDPND